MVNQSNLKIREDLPYVCGITLDLDNTLWDVLPTIQKAEQKSYRELQERFPKITERYTIDDIAKLRQKIVNTQEEIRHDVTAIRARVYEKLLIECDYHNLFAIQLVESFIADRSDVDLYPDVLSALETLSSLYPVAALTDGNADLSIIGIQHYFATTVTARDIGHAKPHSAGFHKACETIGTKPEETVHIGDHPIADMAGARRAGLQTMWINRSGATWNESFTPDYTITDLSEAVEIFCSEPVEFIDYV